MPRLYAFVACEKVILDQSNVPSLISLFSIMMVGRPVDPTELPANAVAPKEWMVFASWDFEPGDEGIEYVQRGQVLWPDRTLFFQVADIRFTMEPGRKQQTISPLLGFPIGQWGMCTVRMWLERDGVSVFEPQPIQIEVRRVAPATTGRPT